MKLYTIVEIIYKAEKVFESDYLNLLITLSKINLSCLSSIICKPPLQKCSKYLVFSIGDSYLFDADPGNTVRE